MHRSMRKKKKEKLLEYKTNNKKIKKNTEIKTIYEFFNNCLLFYFICFILICIFIYILHLY